MEGVQPSPQRPRQLSIESQPDSDLPLLSWEEIQQKIFRDYPRNRSSLLDGLESQGLNSLLSANSYPLPERLSPQGVPTSGEKAPLYGGIFVEPSPLDRPSADVATPEPPTTKPTKRTRSEASTPAASASSKKRGRPRKGAVSPTGEDPDERRRMQIRLAQRAYRSRKEASISAYKSRIEQLETTVEKMSTAVLGFSDQLVQSGVLASYSDLTAHLRDTVETCLNLAKDASPDGEADMPDYSPHSEESLSEPEQKNPNPSLFVGLMPRPSENIVQGSPLNHAGAQKSSTSSSPYAIQSAEFSAVELPAFIDRLHVACLYQGYLGLCDPSISIERLQRPFRLLLTMMTREQLASYFEAAMQARISQKRLEAWNQVPFFSLGGAGTHYPRSPARMHGSGTPLHPLQRWSTVHDPLAQYPTEIQEELEGEWFDMHDLEGFLREQRVRLFACHPSQSKEPASAQVAVNVGRLIQVLISKGVCLGRAPGFRRRDVEKALRAAAWT